MSEFGVRPRNSSPNFPLLPVLPEIDDAMMPPQKIHKTFVIGIRNSEQRKHLAITSSGPLQTLANKTFHLGPSDQPVSEWPRNRFPKINDDDVLVRLRSRSLVRQEDVVGMNNRARNHTDGGFDDVLQLTDISWKAISHQLSDGVDRDPFS